MSQYETLDVTQEGGIMTIALNRPEKMNTFNTTLRREIAQAAIAANLEDSVRVVILTGNGRAFRSRRSVGPALRNRRQWASPAACARRSRGGRAGCSSGPRTP